MAANIKNIALGILFASFIFVGLFAGVTGIISQQDQTLNPQLQDINIQFNNTINVLYEESKTQSQIADESKVYTGITELGIISADAYKTVKSMFITPITIAQNATTSFGQLGLVPDWVFTMAITAFMLTLLAVFMAAVFRARGGII